MTSTNTKLMHFGAIQLIPEVTWHRCVSVSVGWLLFMVFCGAGLVALPLDMIREFLGRPKACITKSEYMTRAKALGNKAKGIMVLPPTLSLLLNPVAV